MDQEKVRQLVKEYSKLVVANMIVNKIIQTTFEAPFLSAIAIPQSDYLQTFLESLFEIFGNFHTLHDFK